MLQLLKSSRPSAYAAFLAIVAWNGSIGAASIVINNDVATGTILDGASILVDGWVYDAQHFVPDPNNPMTPIGIPDVNKVKIYLFYQQIRPNLPLVPGSTRYQLDASFANFSNGSTVDTPYTGSVTANLPNRDNTTVTFHCWFLRCEALLDTPEAPNAPIAYVEKIVDLTWSDPL
jgi:hypothetical protein